MTDHELAAICNRAPKGAFISSHHAREQRNRLHAVCGAIVLCLSICAVRVAAWLLS
jgi:hypothetical protein